MLVFSSDMQVNSSFNTRPLQWADLEFVTRVMRLPRVKNIARIAKAALYNLGALFWTAVFTPQPFKSLLKAEMICIHALFWALILSAMGPFLIPCFGGSLEERLLYLAVYEERGGIVKSLPKAQRTRGLSSYHKFKHKS